MSFLFHKYLLQISEQLSSKEVGRLCYLCRDYVSKAESANISEGYQLFDILEENELLAPGKFAFLSECFQTIGRYELAEKVLTGRH